MQVDMDALASWLKTLDFKLRSNQRCLLPILALSIGRFEVSRAAPPRKRGRKGGR